jgi:hypothetical protein
MAFFFYHFRRETKMMSQLHILFLSLSITKESNKGLEREHKKVKPQSLL